MISFSSLRAFKTVGLTTLVISLPGHPQGWFLSNSFFLEDVFLWTGHSEYVFLLAFLLFLLETGHSEYVFFTC